MKLHRSIILPLLSAILFLTPYFAHAGLPTNGLTTINETVKLTTDSPESFVGKIILNVMVLFGIILVVLIVYTGFLWLTAGGNPEQVKKAKQWMINAVIGIVIISAAYIITNFILISLLNTADYSQGVEVEEEIPDLPLPPIT